MKYRIKFFSGFCSTEECKRVFEKICQVELMDNYGPEKDIFIVTDDSYTHAIIITPTKKKNETKNVVMICIFYNYVSSNL